MKFSLDSSDTKHAFKLLTFANRSKDQIANYFSISDSFLWRRDSIRLVAFESFNGFSGNFNYDMKFFDDFILSDSFELSNNGVLSLYKGDKMITSIEPASISLEPNSLVTIKQKEFDFHCLFPSLLLTRHISVIQRIIDANKLDADKQTFVFDFQQQICFIKELPDESFELPFDIKKGTLSKIWFSFSYFRDLLVNASKFDKTMSLKVFSPYYAVFQYQPNLYSTICLVSND